MSEERSKAEIDAEREFNKCAGKDYEYIAEKYADVINKITAILDKHNTGRELSDSDYYNFQYCTYLEKRFSHILADQVLKELGYSQDNKGMWNKKKKGFFR